MSTTLEAPEERSLLDGRGGGPAVDAVESRRTEEQVGAPADGIGLGPADGDDALPSSALVMSSQTSAASSETRSRASDMTAMIAASPRPAREPAASAMAAMASASCHRRPSA